MNAEDKKIAIVACSGAANTGSAIRLHCRGRRRHLRPHPIRSALRRFLCRRAPWGASSDSIVCSTFRGIATDRRRAFTLLLRAQGKRWPWLLLRRFRPRSSPARTPPLARDRRDASRLCELPCHHARRSSRASRCDRATELATPAHLRALCRRSRSIAFL